MREEQKRRESVKFFFNTEEHRKRRKAEDVPGAAGLFRNNPLLAGNVRRKAGFPGIRRILGTCIGIIIIAMGIAFFKKSVLGNDSITALNLRLAELRGIVLGVQNLQFNLIVFMFQLWLGRKYIGLGTFVNGIAISFIVTCISDNWLSVFPAPSALPLQLFWVALAVLITSLGCSLYQTADLGVAPYDFISLAMAEYLPFPYFGCRVSIDLLCAVLCFLLGGLVGLGTLICALGLGPFIHFYNKHFSEKLLRHQPAKG